MGNDVEWYYSELLDRLKEKEREKDEAYYRPIELELPLYEAPRHPFDNEKSNSNVQIERGVLIIEF